MSAGSVPAPAAPLVRVGPVWTFGFGLAWFGFWMANLVPIQLLLPIQLAILAPESKVWAFAVVNAVAGVVALVALPLFGVWSDRSRSRFGRRRAPIVFGAGVCAVGLVMVAQEQQGWVPLMLWWSVAILGLSAMAAGLTAVVADRVPEPQRGMISSAIYGPQALGVVVGLAAVVVFGLGVGGSYVLLAVALVGLSLPFVLGYQDRAAGATVLSLRDVGKSLLVDPRQHPDFAWAFAGRLLLTLANSFGTCYMLYFLTDRVRPADPEAMLLLLTGVYLVAGVVASVVFGFWSDRLGRRRPFAVAAALAQAVAGFLLIGATSTPALIVASVLSGGGFAAYLTINQAVVTRVLPDADNRATDLGLMNIGVLVPPAIAPLLASAVVTSGGSGYPVLFLITGLVALAATAATRLVRSVP